MYSFVAGMTCLAAEKRLASSLEELSEGKQALTVMKERIASLREHDKALEKNFKKEFPALNYNQLEALVKSYKSVKKYLNAL
jgi:flagellar motility protein MotE (MotC chaperone)